jgi:hypothetical protein
MMTLQLLEGYFQRTETAELNRVMVRSYEALYEGRYPVKEEVNRNLREYLSKSLKHTLGIQLNILVKTRDDRLLFPLHGKKEFQDPEGEGDFSEIPLNTLNYMEVAADNYKILNEGLTLSLDVQIRHNSWLSNSVLIFYVFLSVMLLKHFVQKGVRESQREEDEKRVFMERLTGELDSANVRLKEIETKEKSYQKKISELNKDKRELARDVNGLLEEMERLEEGLDGQRRLKEEMGLKVIQLRQELERSKDKARKPRQKKKQLGTTQKRFKTLYKHLHFTDRAIEGFLSLSDEFQLKAEEIIYNLNQDDSLVPVKRKVFGKGGKMNILEVDFSYSGRLYYQKDSQSKIKVVTIGTKNSQEKDLAYLDSIK